MRNESLIESINRQCWQGALTVRDWLASSPLRRSLLVAMQARLTEVIDAARGRALFHRVGGISACRAPPPRSIALHTLHEFSAGRGQTFV